MIREGDGSPDVDVPADVSLALPPPRLQPVQSAAQIQPIQLAATTQPVQLAATTQPVAGVEPAQPALPAAQVPTPDLWAPVGATSATNAQSPASAQSAPTATGLTAVAETGEPDGTGNAYGTEPAVDSRPTDPRDPSAPDPWSALTAPLPPAPPRRRHPRTRVAALLLAAAAVVALAAATLTGLTGQRGALATSVPDAQETASAPATPTTTSSPDPNLVVGQAVQALLDTRSKALNSKDKAAWLGTVADPADSFGTTQSGLFDRMTALPIGHVAVQGITVKAQTTADLASPWVASFTLAYQFLGYDREQRTFDLSYLVTPSAGGWRFSGPGPEPSEQQPFDLASMGTVRSAKTLVIGDQPDSTLAAFLTYGDTAYDRIAAIWGQAVPSVIVVPKTVEEMAAQLGGSASDLDQIGAVTEGPVGRLQPATSDRVFVNPADQAQLTRAGRQFIVTHELTHVTARATTTHEVPKWLSEGFADDTGFQGTGLSVKVFAQDLIADVRKGKGPSDLPDDDAFDPAKTQIAPAYTAGWLAVDRMRQRFGQDKVVAFYRAIAGTTTAAPMSGMSTDELTDAAFQNVLGTTRAAFVADWLAYVRKLAR